MGPGGFLCGVLVWLSKRSFSNNSGQMAIAYQFFLSGFIVKNIRKFYKHVKKDEDCGRIVFLGVKDG